MQKKREILFRVRFLHREEPKFLEVVVKSVQPSQFTGLLTLQDFVFHDQAKHVILPSEDEARKRFSRTHRLHIPFHNIVSIEEFESSPVDVKHLPFVKEIDLHPN